MACLGEADIEKAKLQLSSLLGQGGTGCCAWHVWQKAAAGRHWHAVLQLL